MADPEVQAQATVTATLFSDGRLVLMEHGTWYREDATALSYTEWHEDLGTCEPQELMYRLVTEMQDRI